MVKLDEKQLDYVRTLGKKVLKMSEDLQQINERLRTLEAHIYGEQPEAKLREITPDSRKTETEELREHIADPGIKDALDISGVERRFSASPELVQTTISKGSIPAGHTDKEARTSKEKKELSLETLIGGTLLNRIGIVSVILGTGFFLKHAFQNNWIGETGRIMIGIILGIAFLLGGEHFQKKNYTWFAQGLSGGGIAILYFSIFAAFSFYHLIPQGPAFAMMIMVTIASGVLSIRYNTVAIAVLGIIGGFLTPVMLSTGVAKVIPLFAYIAMLDLGVLGISYFKRWAGLNWLSYICTQILVNATIASENLSPEGAALSLSVFFLIFAFVAIFYNIVNKRSTSTRDLIMILVNGLVYFSLSYFHLRDDYRQYLGFFAVLLSLVYFLFGYFAMQRSKEDRLLILTFFATALTFLTTAVPIQLTRHWITVAWVVEAIFLLWIGLRTNNPAMGRISGAIIALVFFRLVFWEMDMSAGWLLYLWLAEGAAFWAAGLAFRNQMLRGAGLGILGFAILRLFVHEMSRAYYFSLHAFTPLFNWRALAFLLTVTAIFAVAYFYRKKEMQLADWEKKISLALPIVGNLLLMSFLTAEVDTYYAYKGYNAAYSSSLANSKQVAISIVWGVYALVLMVIGFWKQWKGIRILAIVGFAITIAKVFLFDLASLEAVYRIMAFMALGVILLAVSFLYQKYGDILLGIGERQDEKK